jgi:hypothetical protein
MSTHDIPRHPLEERARSSRAAPWEEPSPTEYAIRHPELAGEIQELFPRCC